MPVQYEEVTPTMTKTVSLLFALIGLLSSSILHANPLFTIEQIAAKKGLQVQVKEEIVASGLHSSWSLNISPDGFAFLVNRTGGFQVFDQNWANIDYTFMPKDLFGSGQGGLLDIEFHPDYLQNGWIYMSYAAGTASENKLKVVRFKLSPADKKVTSVETIFSLNETKDTPAHYGGRLAFMKDKSLLISSGDGFDYRERAQVLSSHQGKILRVSDTGKALADNPYFDTSASPQSYVYSLGHRNPQALIVSPTNMVIANEHGPKGGDEVNIIKSGHNYGWPVVTNGKDYIGSTISPFKDYEGMQLPAHDWTPSIAPSGMVLFETNDAKHRFLHQHLLVTSLKYKRVHALRLSGDMVSEEFLLYQSSVRLRDIAIDKNNNILLLTDGEDAQIIRLSF